MCMGGGGGRSRSMPKPPPLPPAPPPPPPPPTPPPAPKPLQAATAKPTLQIGGTRRNDSLRRRRGASSVASAQAVNTGGSEGGVNV